VILQLLGVCLAASVMPATEARAQLRPGAPDAETRAPAPDVDPLGRTTPRGTVRGFLSAANRGDLGLARHYLNTTQGDRQGEQLARQLFVVLDTRLPARLAQVSDHPDGSRTNPLMPDRELVGTITGPAGGVEIALERVTGPDARPVWLFARSTVQSIPVLYDAMVAQQGQALPAFLGGRLGGLRLVEWLAVLVGLPLLYLATGLLNRLLTPLVGRVRRKLFGTVAGPRGAVLPVPARLLLLVFVGRSLLATLPLSLMVRLFLWHLATLLTIASVAWLLLLITAELERKVARRLPPANYAAAISLLRVGRRLLDVLILLVALLTTLRHFGVDPTPVLAGLGVGGIAVALAAQKTLENVIAGASLIFDEAVRVGDFLKVAEFEGTVEHVGLRSTRIRTPARTVVSVPNSQIANMIVETLSARDKYWFHPIVALRYGTPSDQLQAVIDAIQAMLAKHPAIDRASVRVRFLRLGSFSLDVEVFAYVFARDWPHFLEIQEQLLLGVTEAVHRAGASLALPSQAMYMAGSAASPGGGSVTAPLGTR
jgi:MscS family membrane protein